MQQTNSIYVEVGGTDSYILAIRYPALVFGGVHFRITSRKNYFLNVKEVETAFGLTFPKDTTAQRNYLSFDYNLYAITKHQVKTKLLNRNALAQDLTGVKLLYNQFLDYLESKAVVVDRVAALDVYLDTLKLELKDIAGESNPPTYIEPLTVEVGGLVFKLGE